MATDVGKLKEFISENIDTIRNIRTLARFVGACPETLRKDFVRVERITLGKYMASVRILRAMEMLGRTDLQCKEICFAVGFSREDIGSRAFKKCAGITMEQFKQLSPREKETKQLDFILKICGDRHVVPRNPSDDNYRD